MDEAEAVASEGAVDGNGLRLVDLVRLHVLLDRARIGAERGGRARVEDVAAQVDELERLQRSVLAVDSAEAAWRRSPESAHR